MELYGYINRYTQVRTLGEKFNIRLYYKPVGTPITGLSALISATFDCWDENGNNIITAFPIVHISSGSKQWCIVSYVMQTGPTKPITLPGTYTYQFTVNVSDGTSTIFQQVGLINPTP